MLGSLNIPIVHRLLVRIAMMMPVVLSLSDAFEDDCLLHLDLLWCVGKRVTRLYLPEDIGS